MSKLKTLFYCQNCGAQSVKWLGKCPSCGSWNTYIEEVLSTPDKGDWKVSNAPQVASKPRRINEVTQDSGRRIITHDIELNRVLGGGIMPGSVVLLGGEPGIGKSTLLLQLALSLKGHKVLYVSGEESESQIKQRSERIGKEESECYLLAETQTRNIFKQIEDLEPDFLIVDSIQTMQSSFVESSAGSVSQVKECTAEFIKFAKETGTPVFLVGHITKEGSIAGPKILEHMVDTVLQFEGDRHLFYRLLRTLKNRFGSTYELGMYEMQGSGLRQVNNPSEILLSRNLDGSSGTAIAAFLEGNRPLLIEIQALVSVAAYGTPQRNPTGFDNKRLGMLLAVLEKRAGFRLSGQDVFLNIAGGLRVEDPAVDLAVCAALASSYQDLALPPQMCFAAEVGLGGEVRAVNRIESRISEARKLGFKQIMVSKYNFKEGESMPKGIEIIPITRITEMWTYLLKTER